jgi:Uma2 family endonuclease
MEVSSPTPRHQMIVLNILGALHQYLGNTSGVLFHGLEFALSDLLRLRPDICVLLGEKARGLDRHRSPVPGSPDIAIEVISPTERASESHDKIRVHLRNGVTEAWQVFPKSQTVEIHGGMASVSLDATQSISSDLLPDLQIPIASFFV